MANPNVIDYSTFSKHHPHHYPTNSPTTNFHPHQIREPDAEYGDDTLAHITALLQQPLWPQFPHGAYLDAQQAARFYRLAHAVNGLNHCLNRSAHTRAMQHDYTDAAQSTPALSGYRESQFWQAMSELSGDLVKLADELQAQAMEES